MSTGASRAHRKSLSAPLYPSPITLPNQSSSAPSPAAASPLLIHPSIGSFAFILAKRNPCHCSSSRARQVRAFNLPHERRIYIYCTAAYTRRRCGCFFPLAFSPASRQCGGVHIGIYREKRRASAPFSPRIIPGVPVMDVGYMATRKARREIGRPFFHSFVRTYVCLPDAVLQQLSLSRGII